MGHVNAFLLLACFGFGASGCAAPTISEEADSVANGDPQALTDAKLLALGDSIAFGYNPLADFKKSDELRWLSRGPSVGFHGQECLLPG